jgi:hypothetical protein
MTVARVVRSPIFFGAAVAVLAVGLQVLFSDRVPLAYGICTVCHARDLLSWIINLATRFPMDTPTFAASALVLTPVGLVAGSFIAARTNKEFSWVRASNPLLMLLGGVFVSLFGLVVMSCPTRVFLRLGYGDPLALFAAAGLLAGIAVATLIMKRVR